MPIAPQIAEDVLGLAERPGLTRTQIVILKVAAALLWQDELPESVWSLKNEEIDSRLKVAGDEWELIPDRFEMTHGVVCPKEWATPNRLRNSDLWSEEFDALVASGVEHYAAMKLASERLRDKLLERQRAYSSRHNDKSSGE